MSPHIPPSTTRRGTLRRNKAYRQVPQRIRQEEIREALRLGLTTLSTIADRLGVTKERVRQLTRTMPDVQAVMDYRRHPGVRRAIRLELVAVGGQEAVAC